METIRKYVIIGPESTGKSTLSRQLAEHYRTVWVPEYAREYLEKNGMDYSFADLLTIAKGQIELEEEHADYLLSNVRKEVSGREITSAASSPLLFIDTDMYVMKVWCEYVFNQCHNWILNRIAGRKYDGYLLCDTGLPWVKDNLREYPDEKNRKILYHYYKDLLVYQHVPWVNISGTYQERFEKAVTFIEEERAKGIFI